MSDILSKLTALCANSVPTVSVERETLLEAKEAIEMQTKMIVELLDADQEKATAARVRVYEEMHRAMLQRRGTE